MDVLLFRYTDRIPLYRFPRFLKCIYRLSLEVPHYMPCFLWRRKDKHVKDSISISSMWIGVHVYYMEIIKWYLLKYITEKHTFAAINKVLFRQGHQFSSFTEMLSFQCSRSWKCPTGSTLSLKKEPREINKKSRMYILSVNFICSFFLNIITVTSVDIVICIECYRKVFWKCLVNKTDKIGSHIDFSKIEISVPIASLEGRVNHAWGVSK